MNRGKPVKAKYGDKGGVYIPSGMFHNEHDRYLNAVAIAVDANSITVVFLEGMLLCKVGDIHVIDAKLWHGSAYYS